MGGRRLITIRRTLALLLLIIFALGFALTASSVPRAAEAEVSILFTHDMHAHFEPERFMSNGTVAERGGFSRSAPTSSQRKYKPDPPFPMTNGKLNIRNYYSILEYITLF
jgi:2',3'-cyclic-nucleotide 2'-phosphodiesterase (5'-nucleotidase family)